MVCVVLHLEISLTVEDDHPFAIDILRRERQFAACMDISDGAVGERHVGTAAVGHGEQPGLGIGLTEHVSLLGDREMVAAGRERVGLITTIADGRIAGVLGGGGHSELLRQGILFDASLLRDDRSKEEESQQSRGRG